MLRKENLGMTKGVPASPSGLRPDGLSQSALSQAEPLVPNAAVTLAFCGPHCDHDFQGWREFDGGGEAVCTKCGMGAMEDSLWNDY